MKPLQGKYAHIRRVILRPYRSGCGPRFVLDLYDPTDAPAVHDRARPDSAGRWPVAYRLRMLGIECTACNHKGSTWDPKAPDEFGGVGTWVACETCQGGRTPARKTDVTLFESDDSSFVYEHTAIDSDKRVAGVLFWLCLKPGDTDSEFFADYTPAQLAFAGEHAETLELCAMDRFDPERYQ